ncbi:MAG: hypothetical protein J6Y65_04295 [Eggerthellaceae bacterium]|nr:hypothetical protein [Eggerthellaceae bacterium]
MLYLILSTAALLILGLLYGFSMFAAPMIEDFALDGVGSAFYVMMAFFCIGSLVGSAIQNKLGVKAALIIAGLMFGAGFALTGLLAADNGVIILYLCYAVLGGFGTGVGYNAIISTTNIWFPDRIGLSAGVMLLGFGIASLVFGNAALAIRPLVGGMGTVLPIIGGLGAVFTISLALVLTKAPENISEIMKAAQAETAAKKAVVKAPAIQEVESVSTKDMVKKPIFYAYYLTNVFLAAVGLAIIGNVAADAQFLGAAAAFASLLVGFVSTFNGVSRVVMGAVLDRIGVVKTFILAVGLALTAMVLIVVGFVANIVALYVAGALILGFSYGCCPVVGSSFTRKKFGSKFFPSNLAVINSTLLFSALLNLGLASLITSSRMDLLFVVLGVCALAFVGALVFARLWKK